MSKHIAKKELGDYVGVLLDDYPIGDSIPHPKASHYHWLCYRLALHKDSDDQAVIHLRMCIERFTEHITEEYCER